MGWEREILSPLMSRDGEAWFGCDRMRAGKEIDFFFFFSIAIFRGLRRLLCMFQGEGWE